MSGSALATSHRVGTQEETFSGVVEKQSGELAQSASAAAAQMEVQAGFLMAMKFPRDESGAEKKILARCRDLAFAQEAMYSKPQGKVQDEKTGKWVQNFVKGLSVRFVEEILRYWKNVKIFQTVIYEDDRIRVKKVRVLDLESNIDFGQEFTIEKTVERKSASGRTVVSERLNDRNEKVFVVVATEDELFQKENNWTSKILRNNGLRLIPGHIQQMAEDAIMETRQKSERNAVLERKNLIDAFVKLGVTKAQLEKYFAERETRLSEISLDQIDEMRDVYTGLKNGETSWREVSGQDPEPARAPADLPGHAILDISKSETKDADGTPIETIWEIKTDKALILVTDKGLAAFAAKAQGEKKRVEFVMDGQILKEIRYA